MNGKERSAFRFQLSAFVLAIITLLAAITAFSAPPKSWRQMAEESLQDGDYAKAAEWYGKWTEADPTDAVALYNLACCYSILKQPDEAMAALTNAQAAGWSDSAHASVDPDLESLHARPEFQKLLGEIARNQRTRFGGLPLYSCKQERAGQYFVVLPDTYDPAQSYPLVILLHGYGSNPERFSEVTNYINENDFIYAVPEAPYALMEGSSRSFSHLRERRDFSEDDNTVKLTADWIMRVADDMKIRYPIKGDKIYLIGFSQGGAMTHVVAALYPEHIAGYCAVGGYIIKNAVTPELLGNEKSAGVHALVIHGRRDVAVAPEEGVYAFNMLKQSGVDVKLELLDIPHRFAPEVGVKVNEWLVSLTRE